jgi:hypothetical protein
MNRLLLLLFGLLVLGSSHAQNAIKPGDLLFQNLDCGPLCEAIETVTYGKDGLKFSHIGLVIQRHDSLLVIEAIGKQVQLTPIATFFARTKNPIYWARLKNTYQPLLDSALNFALAQEGIPYDEPFLYNNKKYYCSELIYDAFKAANHNTPLFTLEPMTFKHPFTQQFFPAWVNYYKDLGIAIPEGELGINPAGISRSSVIDWLGIIKLH